MKPKSAFRIVWLRWLLMLLVGLPWLTTVTATTSTEHRHFGHCGFAAKTGGGGKLVQGELDLGDPRTPVTHRGSADFEGPSHVYAFRSPDSSVYKVGKSSQGTRVGDGASIRAEEQVRELNRTVGPGHTSEIRKTFDSSGAALDYERRLRDRVRRRYGDDKLPGNRENY